MGETYMVSDYHFKHKGIIAHCDRPFSSSDEMDEVLIENTNKVVKFNDTLYLLGDFCWWNLPLEEIYKLRRRINCKNIHLIWGNHDKHLKKFHRRGEINDLFTTYQDYLELNHNGQCYILFHYPIRDWDKKFHQSRHCSGHTHSKNRIIEANSFNIGVDAWDFTPANINQIEELATK
jgi:calcineurin-like phosphoesterase family protein